MPKKFLPQLGVGKGSSRETFKLSANRVLKIAKNEAGIDQTQTELEFIRNNSIPKNFTTIEEFDPKGTWVISELVVPFNSEKKFEQETGIYYPFYENLIRTIQDKKPQNLQSLLFIAEHDLEEANNKIIELQDSEDFKSQIALQDYEDTFSELEPFVHRLKALLKSKTQYNFMMKIMNLLERGLEWGDLRFDHFGKNSNGDILIYDYGFSTEVYNKHYRTDNSNPNSEEDSVFI